MKISDVDTITPAGFPNELPLTLELRGSRTSAALFLSLLIMALLAVLLPITLTLGSALAGPTSGGAFAEQPAATAKIAAGALLWCVLWSWPIGRFWKRLTLRQVITLTPAGRVQVETRGLVFSSRQDNPLNAYRGIAHNVRSSLSGTRHELILEHSAPQRSLLLHTAPLLTDVQTQQLAVLLGCPILNLDDARNANAAAARNLAVASDTRLAA